MNKSFDLADEVRYALILVLEYALAIQLTLALVPSAFFRLSLLSNIKGQ